ncbi:MAG: GNAT family N-acetyltransferase [Parvularcula sp.]
MSLSVRKAQAADIGALAKLHGIIFDPGWDEAFWTKAVQDRAAHVWCCGEGDGLVGLLAIRAAAGEADILTIGVDPRVRRSGLARGLLVVALEELIHQGTDRISLEVAITNSAAIALYEEFGFWRAGLREKYYENGADALVMVWTKKSS